METSQNKLFLANFFDEGIYITDLPASVSVIPENIIEPDSNLQKDTVQIECLGKNTNGVLLVTNELQHDWVIPKERLVITTILSLFKLDFDEVALVNLARLENIGLSELIDCFRPRQMIGFNLPGAFAQDTERDKVFKIAGSNCCLCSDPLSDIAWSKAKKAKLWKNLKIMFE